MGDLFESITHKRETQINELVNRKIDLEEKLSILISLENKSNHDLWSKDESTHNCECSNIALFIRSIRPVYVGPAYCFNRFIDAYVEDTFWDYIKYKIDSESQKSSSLSETLIIVELQNCLYEIKMGLDRLVQFFSLYYRGVSPTTTFGRITAREDGTTKSKGFMAYVIANKDSDEIFKYVYDEYHNWIKECVKPRDAITHYKDFVPTYEFDSTCGVVRPLHCNSINDKEISVSTSQLESYVTNYYAFYNHILTDFIKKAEKDE